MASQLGIMEILGLAASLSLLSGWRFYLCLMGTGLAMHLGALPMPAHLPVLQVLGNPWLIGAAGFAALCELAADKVAWLDSVWDAIHTLIRPLGGALLALAVIDPADPAVQAITFVLGGGGALLAHGSKAGTRAVVNASPEPISNAAVSTSEDAIAAGLLYLIYQYPGTAAGIALLLLIGVIALLAFARRVFRRAFARPPV